jgi:PIN domain nuclease of toxin-antitoxin system
LKLLLDTQILLWAAAAPERLSEKARAALTLPENELLFSAASLWEIAIKSALDRADFRIQPKRFRRELERSGYRELAITADHVLATADLPPLHKDPFDRLLIAQAVVEGLPLLTADATVARYRGPVQRV